MPIVIIDGSNIYAFMVMAMSSKELEEAARLAGVTLEDPARTVVSEGAVEMRISNSNAAPYCSALGKFESGDHQVSPLGGVPWLTMDDIDPRQLGRNPVTGFSYGSLFNEGWTLF